VLVTKKRRPKITPLKAGIAIILVIILWMGLQIAVQAYLNSPFFKLLLLCILGFGFMFITFLLKYS
jgi:hypothetical protein